MGAFAILERGFVREKHMLVRDRDDIVMEGTALNRDVRLTDEERARRVEPMVARNRF